MLSSALRLQARGVLLRVPTPQPMHACRAAAKVSHQ